MTAQLHQHVEEEDTFGSMDAVFAEGLRIDAAYMAHRHMVEHDGDDVTLCGINVNEYPRLPIGCNCGNPECHVPPTCPVCKMVWNGEKAS